MSEKPDIARRLAMIAYHYGCLTPADSDGRHKLWALFRREAVGKDPRFGVGIARRSTLDSWFGEGRSPQGENMVRLAAALRAYANSRGLNFEDDWLTLSEPDFVDRLGLRLADFTAAMGETSSADLPKVTLPFVIPEERTAKLRQKYGGIFHVYRFHARRNAIVREVMVVGTEFEGGIGKGYLVDAKDFFYRLHFYTTYHTISVQMFEGEDGDGFRVESMLMRRMKFAKRVFTAMRVKLSESSELPIAAKCLIFRQSDEVPRLDKELALSRFGPTTGYFEPGTSIYEALAPWLELDTLGEKTTFKNFGKNVLYLDTGLVVSELDQFDDTAEDVAKAAE